MTDKELRRLSRSELLEILIAQMEENEKLKKHLEEAKEKAHSRQIAIEQSGSIAEAAMKLSGIFDAAQEAASLYMENIKQLSSGSEGQGCRQSGEKDQSMMQEQKHPDSLAEKEI